MTPIMPMMMPAMLERSTGGISSSAPDVEELPSDFQGAEGTYFFAASGILGSPTRVTSLVLAAPLFPLPLLPALLRLMAPQSKASQLSSESRGSRSDLLRRLSGCVCKWKDGA